MPAHDVVTYVGPGPAGPVAGPWVQLEAQRLPQPVSEGETGELHGPQHEKSAGSGLDTGVGNRDAGESGPNFRISGFRLFLLICESALKPKSFFGIEC